MSEKASTILKSTAIVVTVAAILVWVGIAFVWNESGDSDLDITRQEIGGGTGMLPSRNRSAEIPELPESPPSVSSAAESPPQNSVGQKKKDLASVHVKVFHQLTSRAIPDLGLVLSRMGLLNDKKLLSKHRTNENGEALIENLTAGIYFLETVGVTDHERFVLAPGENKTVLFGLVRSVAISGRCVDEKGNGVAEASIYISEYTFQPTLGTIMAVSDDAGYYRIAATDPGRFIQARLDGWSPSPMIKLESDYDTNGIAPLRMITKGAQIKGTLRSGLAPVPGSKVILTELDVGDSKTGQKGSITLETMSDEDGKFVFNDRG